MRKIDGTSEILCFKEKVKQSDNTDMIISVMEITKENDFFKKAYNSSSWTQKPLLDSVSNEVGVFEYRENIVAVLFSEVSDKYYYAYIYNKSTDVVVEVMKLEKNQNINPNPNSLIADSPKINLVTFLSTGGNNGDRMSGWGSCMRGAMDELYDDWDNEPFNTFGCILSGPLCAIGGGIACGLKQIR